MIIKTDRDIFEVVANHLLRQRCRSMQEYFYLDGKKALSCAYRGKENTKCAIGAIISDQFYDSSFGRKGCDDADIFNAILLSNPDWEVSNSSHRLLSELQNLHDSELPFSWEYFLGRFKFSAEGHFLNNIWRY